MKLIVCTQLARLPQPSVAVQVRKILPLPVQLVVSKASTKLMFVTPLHVSVAVAAPVLLVAGGTVITYSRPSGVNPPQPLAKSNARRGEEVAAAGSDLSVPTGLSPDAQREVHLLVAPLRELHVLEPEIFLLQRGRRADPAKLPRSDVAEVVVIAEGLVVDRLVLIAEVSAAGLLAMQRVSAHELGQLEEVVDAARLLQRLVQRLVVTQHSDVAVVRLARL